VKADIPMLNAVLFDLDNTLVLFDETAFYGRYFRQLADFFADILPPPQMQERVLRATRALLDNSGAVSNAQFFIQAFSDGLPQPPETLWSRFLDFYRSAYDTIPVSVRVPDGLKGVLAAVLQTDLKTVVATNPIFPEMVQRKRLAWAGAGGIAFDLITHIENMKYVKPRPEYFRQICAMIGEAPEACLMVGNDPVNDMAAGVAGLHTYLTTDAAPPDYTSLIPADDRRRNAPPPAPDHTGPLRGVIPVIEGYCAG
jgi:FMN phosphatase YigB (HAD superfamily)